ncbi:MAG: pyruvate kinase, partial [Actinomycetota bacterium]|nr:pyruvate kinase [Actinomycetota bacterium]
MTRRTKIIATIGPASESEGVLREMIQAGMDIARIGLAHGTYELAEERIKLIRKVASEEGKPVGILLDLPGPKIRVGDFGEKQVELIEGSDVELFIGSQGSTIDRIEVDYEGLLTHVQEGAELNIGDGRAVVKVMSVFSDRLQATILHGGVLSGRPGVHIPSDQLSLTAPTSEDLEA